MTIQKKLAFYAAHGAIQQTDSHSSFIVNFFLACAELFEALFSETHLHIV